MNWLISQLINRTVNGTHLSQVFVSFEHYCIDRCDARFNIRLYETSSPDPIGARNLSNYELEHRVSFSNSSSGDSNHLNMYSTEVINFSTDHSSFYFSIEHLLSCLFISRVMVFYRVCPLRVQNMIIYPETIAPRGATPQVITASCIENAEPENGNFPRLGCMLS